METSLKAIVRDTSGLLNQEELGVKVVFQQLLWYGHGTSLSRN
jgi:hypothetical protein